MFLSLQKRMGSNPYEYNWPSLRQDSSSLVGGEKSSMYVSRCRFPQWLSSKESTCSAGDAGLTPGSGRSLGGGNGNPLQYSGLGNPTDRGAWWAMVHEVIKELDTTKRLNNMCPDADG